MVRHFMLLAWIALILASSTAVAQTTAGTGTTIVFPVIAQTSSFASEVTIFNPGPNPLTVHVTFFEANNSSAPGTKVCSDASVPANRSVHFSIGTQCPLAAGNHFGLLVVADGANPQSNYFHGYTRVQNPLGIGFSVEGFPVQNFNNQVSHATGLKRQAASPTYQTNCFVGSLEQPVSYELKLFNDTSGVQIGNTLTGSLNAFEQYRYLDVFGPNGVNAPAGDQFNVRAQFTQTSGGTANLIAFCTVQDNTSFGADFRIAKSYGSPSSNFFAQGGNAFGTTANLGTLDNAAVAIYANNQLVAHFQPTSVNAPNVTFGFSALNFVLGVVGATIGGGGAPGDVLSLDPGTVGSCVLAFGCKNVITDSYGTIAGGAGNVAGDGAGTVFDRAFATVSGGVNNWASGFGATVGGGIHNIASGGGATVGGGSNNIASGVGSTIPGGSGNNALGDLSFAAGFQATIPVTAQGSFLWSDSTGPVSLPAGAHDQFIVASTNGIGLYTYKDFSHGCYIVGLAAMWNCTSDRATKADIAAIDPQDVLARLVRMPITQWRFKGEPENIRHIGPMAQDFRASFGLGNDDKAIGAGDADGVALAAIQALHQLIEERDARIAVLEQQITELQSLRGELAVLRATVAALASKTKVAHADVSQ